MDVGVPHGQPGSLQHLNAEEAFGEREHAAQHLGQGKVRPQLFFVKVVALVAHLFGVVTDVPRLGLRGQVTFQFAAEGE